ncbi:hypothetical protein Y032_0930g3096 [Ancylostoma ceylanicum]|nr:hypothetical protein Y032_0930g3096 [Ancylostoma ceylanicum]
MAGGRRVRRVIEIGQAVLDARRRHHEDPAADVNLQDDELNVPKMIDAEDAFEGGGAEDVFDLLSCSDDVEEYDEEPSEEL